ncbi:serine/threonine protein kinase [Nonomuraea deserti]|uniref:Serine/threonine protein kinase n=1 Tax=Nonomuraea deserti TaxID=1848322 RepID=A0A4R4VA68_9ACTN|nr:serine/threonine protein kinase [Nonomuraea deserti]TDC99362.1 serine/threonine protein kinase [Nonomuraea deserti]
MSKLGKVGPYTLVERLGRGGMGEVYLASTRRGEHVALKVLHDLAEDETSRIRLEREVRALRRVESPYVAKVLDADLGCARPYLVMEHIEGATLLDRVRQDGPLDDADLVDMAQGIAAALAIIHAAGVVHRDLKPGNIIMGGGGPVLIDFGIAQVLDATRLTMTGTFLGTPGYTAPEIFADEQVDSPADVHAWAATVAFAATGRPTFGRGTAEAQMYAVLNGQADLKGVPVQLLPLLRAALNREPGKRPTAALLADRLSRLARAASGADPEPAATGARAVEAAEEAGKGTAVRSRTTEDPARGRAGGTGVDGKVPPPRGRTGADGKGAAARSRGNADGAAVRSRAGTDGPAARSRANSDGAATRGRTGADGAAARGRAGTDGAAARSRASADGSARSRAAADGAARNRASTDGAARNRASTDGVARNRASTDGAARNRASTDGAARNRASTDGAARNRASTDGAARGRTGSTDGVAAARSRLQAEGKVPAPRSRASVDGKVTGPRAKVTASRQRTAAAVRARAATKPQDKRKTGLRAESSTTLPAGNGALLLLAALAVPCVVTSVIWPIASIAITTVLVVLTRTLWMSHWLVRNRSSRATRVALRVLLFPFALAAAAATAAVWPGVPVAVASGGALWATGGGQIDADWWQQPAPVTVAGVVFGMLCGGFTGREIERIGQRLPDLRREGLRALAVLGGFVALCAAAVRAIALLL